MMPTVAIHYLFVIQKLDANHYQVYLIMLVYQVKFACDNVNDS